MKTVIEQVVLELNKLKIDESEIVPHPGKPPKIDDYKDGKSYKKDIDSYIEKLNKHHASLRKSSKVDVGDTDEASASHEKHAHANKPTHEWKAENGAQHKIWHHTSPKGIKTTLLHTTEHGASDAPVMKFNQKGHHSPEDIKKSMKSYDD
jgi:hypothetical protein